MLKVIKINKIKKESSMTRVRWKPLGDIDLFQEEMVMKNGHDLALDMYQENNALIVKMNIAGIDPDHIDIDIEDGVLRISGQRYQEEESSDRSYYHQEIRSGEFERVMSLPFDVDQDAITADVADGVLRIYMPKVATDKKKRVKVSRK